MFSERPSTNTPTLPTTNGSAAPIPCSAETLFSGNTPTNTAPTPPIAIARKPTDRPRLDWWEWCCNADPTIIATPSATKETFMSECSGEQTYFSLNSPHVVFPKSLIVFRLRLYAGDQRSDTTY